MSSLLQFFSRLAHAHRQQQRFEAAQQQVRTQQKKQARQHKQHSTSLLLPRRLLLFLARQTRNITEPQIAVVATRRAFSDALTQALALQPSVTMRRFISIKTTLLLLQAAVVVLGASSVGRAVQARPCLESSRFQDFSLRNNKNRFQLEPGFYLACAPTPRTSITTSVEQQGTCFIRGARERQQQRRRRGRPRLQ